MKMERWITLALAALFFVSGWGWGARWQASIIREEAAKATAGRMQVTMPVDPEDAATTLELLSLLVKKAEAERKVRTQ